ncbi:hypothetical protein C1H46_035698 [Malus baccata]|uniref:Uncharacterized protein n=1 Tax=Malus baccata TaxID=106549 RepID=A0A540KXC7_MALBA|nr:hypothetical protein C1H46_035698 [Malus baccata]
MPCNPHVYDLCNFTSLSIGPHLYVIGASLFDTRLFPIDRPSLSLKVFRFDFSTSLLRCSRRAEALPTLQFQIREGFSSLAADLPQSVQRGWKLNELSRAAECAGFFVGDGKEREFWVMGGYGESRIISGVFPMDEHYRDAVVMELKNGNGGCR